MTRAVAFNDVRQELFEIVFRIFPVLRTTHYE